MPTTFTAKWHISFARTLRVQQIEKGKTSFLAEANPQDVPAP